MEKIIHHGRNVKRFREMMGLKQEGLAMALGDDWNQRKISLLEQKDVIEDDLLELVAVALKVPTEAIRNFDEEAAVNLIGNTFHDSAVANQFHDTSYANFHCTFNPIDKIVELYEALIQSEKEKVEMLKGLLEKK
ncbi:helix-turn-helix domain-containing protein [Pinibacter aurantiacus]|uniref:Helix-turn-helix domain-containing protein n=1 Tax=Pinibacter aurantiacus TaxID=2851599 RepID=A0A9E2W4Z6_9BACT|nr:helix-turn-helix transcriptional regulator [Pinibacter aurantiacus]MBV4358369.1 helix-turn-helix domain-containing protein [Pinibacter aurantiacus]